MWALLSFPTVKTLKSQSPSRDMWGNHFLLAKELSLNPGEAGFLFSWGAAEQWQSPLWGPPCNEVIQS